MRSRLLNLLSCRFPFESCIYWLNFHLHVYILCFFYQQSFAGIISESINQCASKLVLIIILGLKPGISTAYAWPKTDFKYKFNLNSSKYVVARFPNPRLNSHSAFGLVAPYIYPFLARPTTLLPSYLLHPPFPLASLA